ncbi:MAG: LysR family transcriptional regulator [Coriobacteriia bacterium]|nr:LysR family transcriptional regulator [Coriobacteriia bacterium]
MNFLSMEYFAAVAKHRNITKAAGELHITQQTLSAHIASLEKELDCKLLVRKNPLELTYAGESFLRYAESFNEQLRALKNEFCDITDDQRGKIRVGVAHTRGSLIIPRIVEAFSVEYPGIDIELMERTNEQLIALLRDGGIDLFVGRASEDLREFNVQPFYAEEIVMLVPKTLGVDAQLSGEEALGQLADAPFVLCKPQDIAGRIARLLIKQAGFQPREAVLTDSTRTMLSLCTRGVGACFCPAVQAKATLSRADLRKVDSFSFSRDSRYQISFAYPKIPYLRQALKRFMDIGLEVMG